MWLERVLAFVNYQFNYNSYIVYQIQTKMNQDLFLTYHGSDPVRKMEYSS
jgi:hypothetical protein